MRLRTVHLIFFCICAISSFVVLTIGIFKIDDAAMPGFKWTLEATAIGIYCYMVPQGPWH